MSRGELRWLLAVSLAILFLSSLPVLYAWSLEDGDHVFTGFPYNTEDGNSYLGKMRLGARGEWLFYLFYTPEPHEPMLAYFFHLLLGKLAAGLGLSLPLAYHLARIILGLGFLMTIYAFVAHFTPDVTLRRLAWLLCAIGSGLGWLLVLVGAASWLGSLPLDFLLPEAYVFLVLYSLPHLALAESLLLWAILCTLLSFERDGRWSLAAACAAFAMIWVVPFYAGILAAVLAAYLLAIALVRRRLPWREIGLTLVTGLGALPPAAYNAWSFAGNPAFRQLAEQLHTPSPHPAHYVLGFILWLIPAAWGAILVARNGEERWLLPLAWVLVVPLLLYLPYNMQRRMSAAIQVPLAMLAAAGLLAWWRNRPAARTGYVALVSVSNWLLIGGSLLLVAQRSEPVFRSGAEVDALQWLGRHASAGDTVLSSFEVGNIVPVHSDLRVFAGHGPETLYGAQKQAALARFFDAGTEDGWRRDLLLDFGIDYVFYGPHEQALGSWQPGKSSYLVPVYGEAGYTIYQVDRDEILQPPESVPLCLDDGKTANARCRPGLHTVPAVRGVASGQSKASVGAQ